MQVVAKLNYIRIAPRKVRLVVNLIRRKKIEDAQAILNFDVKKASQPLLKLLNSAVANARNNFQLEPNNLYISKITVDEGRKFKRWRARSRGRAAEIQKKTSHITLVLEEIKPAKKTKKVRKTKELSKPLEKKDKKGLSRQAKPKVEEKKIQELKKLHPSKFSEKAREDKPKPEKEITKPKITRGIRKIFRRKAF